MLDDGTHYPQAQDGDNSRPISVTVDPVFHDATSTTDPTRDSVRIRSISPDRPMETLSIRNNADIKRTAECLSLFYYDQEASCNSSQDGNERYRTAPADLPGYPRLLLPLDRTGKDKRRAASKATQEC